MNEGATRHPHKLVATSWTQSGPAAPYSGRNWSPWSFERRVAGLARAGFAGLGLVQEDLAYILSHEAHGANRRARLEWMREIVDREGIEIVELEFLTNWMLPPDDARRQMEQPMRDLLMEAAPILGVSHIKIGNFGLPASVQDLRSRFAEICDEAAAAGARIGMEIFPIDPNAQTLDQALEWCGDNPNGGLFLDVWHVSHAPRITFEDVARLDKSLLVGVELDDGWLPTPEENAILNGPDGLGFAETTLNMRRLPGQGNFDIVGFVRAVVGTGFSGPWGNEILSEEFRRLPMDVAYPRVVRAANEQLDLALSPAFQPS